MGRLHLVRERTGVQLAQLDVVVCFSAVLELLTFISGSEEEMSSSARAAFGKVGDCTVLVSAVEFFVGGEVGSSSP